MQLIFQIDSRKRATRYDESFGKWQIDQVGILQAHSQQTQNVDPTLVKYWASIIDDGPKFNIIGSMPHVCWAKLPSSLKTSFYIAENLIIFQQLRFYDQSTCIHNFS